MFFLCFHVSVRDSLLLIIDRSVKTQPEVLNLSLLSPSITPSQLFFTLSGQFECADRKGWDCNHGDRVEDGSLSNQLWVGGQHCCGFPERLVILAHHSRAVHLGSISVSLRIGLDVREGVMGEGVSDVAHHGGLGHRHTLRVESWEVGWQGASQVSHRVDGDVSDGLGGYRLVSGGGSWSRRNWLRGG